MYPFITFRAFCLFFAIQFVSFTNIYASGLPLAVLDTDTIFYESLEFFPFLFE